MEDSDWVFFFAVTTPFDTLCTVTRAVRVCCAENQVQQWGNQVTQACAAMCITDMNV